MPKLNLEIQRKVKAILVLPEPVKKTKLTDKQIVAQKAIFILNGFEQKLNQAIYLNK